MSTRVGRTVLWDEDEIDDSHWMPLIVFLARCRDEGVPPWLIFELDFRDFMLMNGVERKPRPFIYVYKHVESRRELAVDAEGTPYRFRPVGEDGRFHKTEFLRAVLGLDPYFLREVRRSRAGVDPDRDTAYDGDEDDVPDDWDLEPVTPGERRLRIVR